MRLVATAAIAFWFSASAEAQTAAPQRVTAGPLKLDVYVSETAQLYHIVDQLSQWSEFSHRQYVRYFETLDGGFTENDERLLLEHAAIRKKYGWGRGPDQVFYTPRGLEDALNDGVQKGFLTLDEADSERRIFAAFRVRIQEMIADLSPSLAQFKRSIVERQSAFNLFAGDVARFFDAAPADPISFYMIVNPDDESIGGGYNGGFLTLEIPQKRDAYPTLLHEVFHVFIRLKEEEIDAAIRNVPGLDSETLGEGLAYAVSPGIYHTGDADQLQAEVAGYMRRGAPLSDAYARFNSYGLALRPLLKDALANPEERIETFLPRAVDAWRVLNELDGARMR